MSNGLSPTYDFISDLVRSLLAGLLSRSIRSDRDANETIRELLNYRPPRDVPAMHRTVPSFSNTHTHLTLPSIMYARSVPAPVSASLSPSLDIAKVLGLVGIALSVFAAFGLCFFLIRRRLVLSAAADKLEAAQPAEVVVGESKISKDDVDIERAERGQPRQAHSPPAAGLRPLMLARASTVSQRPNSLKPIFLVGLEEHRRNEALGREAALHCQQRRAAGRSAAKPGLAVSYSVGPNKRDGLPSFTITPLGPTALEVVPEVASATTEAPVFEAKPNEMVFSEGPLTSAPGETSKTLLDSLTTPRVELATTASKSEVRC